MIKHDLIEQVGGIEKAREIVEGAPEGEVYCHFYDPEFHYFAKTSEYFDDAAMIFEDGGWIGVDDGYPHNGRLDKAPYILISDLRTAIAEYEQGSNSSEFKVNDQVVLINKPGSSNSLHRVLEVRHPTTIVVCPINQVSGNDLVILQFCASPYYLRHITGDEFDVGHRIDKKIESDDVKDITNHISPSTRVVDV